MAKKKNTPASWHTQTIICPSCKHAISSYNTSKSNYFACPECNTFFMRTETGGYDVLRSFDKAYLEGFALPLGTTATYKGTDYILVGQLSKVQQNAEVYWDEYIFYSPGVKDYLIFSEFDGHWTVIQPLDHPQFANKNDNVSYKSKTHHLELIYHYKILNIGGEFDWNVLDDEDLQALEYVSQPRTLINERNEQQDRNEWYEGTYISVAKLLTIIHTDPANLPRRGTTVPFDPSTFYPRWQPTMRLTVVLLAFIVLLQAGLYITRPTNVAFEGQYHCQPDTSSWDGCKPVITSAFHINGPSATEIHLKAPELDNDWLELQVVLVNDDNGKSFEVDETIEYYRGYEDGETWSEGGTETYAIVSNVPTGNYHMNIYPFAGRRLDMGGPLPTFNIKVLDNRFLQSNLLVILLLIAGYPVIQYIKRYKFEHTKWFTGTYTTKND